MREVESVTMFEKQDCEIMCEALKVYLVHLDTIKMSCRHPVMIDGMPIEEKITEARIIKSILSRCADEH